MFHYLTPHDNASAMLCPSESEHLLQQALSARCIAQEETHGVFKGQPFLYMDHDDIWSSYDEKYVDGGKDSVILHNRWKECWQKCTNTILINASMFEVFSLLLPGMYTCKGRAVAEDGSQVGGCITGRLSQPNSLRCMSRC